jgi:hypothetical protein
VRRTRWRGLLVLLAAAAVACAGSITANAADDTNAAVDLFAAPAGTGSSCTVSQPCSLSAAQTKVRALTAGMTEDVTVYLRGGVYPLAHPLTFTAADSGRNGYRVTYTAYPGETPTLSGGRTVTGWTLSDASKGIWSAHVPPATQSRQLYVNGVRVPRASGPSPVILTQTPTGYTASAPTLAGWRNPSDIEFVFTGGNGSWTEPRCDVASISGTTITMRQPCWSNLHLPSTPVAPDGDNPSGGFPGLSSTATPSYIENAYELLTPGHWYLDQSDNTVYYMATAGQDVPHLNFVIPVLQSLVQGHGTLDSPVHDLTFSGITFAYDTWLQPSGDNGFAEMQANMTLTGTGAATSQGLCDYISPAGTCPFAAWTKPPAAVDFSAAHNVAFTGDTFIHLGSAGLDLQDGSKNNLVQGDEFTDISSNGIQLGNTTDPQPPGGDTREINDGNVITDNYIHNIGAEYHGAVGIWVGYTQHTQITHNQLDDLPYSGISFGWGGWHTNSQTPDANANINGDNLIADNLVFDHMQYLRDGGAVYTNGSQGQSFAHGLTISGNVAYDDNTDNEYYTDEGSRYVTIDGNVAYQDAGNFNGGCSTTGHIAVTGNYYATGLDSFGCSPPAVDIESSDNTQIPASPGPGDVPAQILSAAGLQPAYRHLDTSAPPAVTMMSPASGPTTGGTQVLVSGSGFTADARVSFGGQPASAVTVLSANFLEATSPAGTGTEDVTVTTAAGASSPGSADQFAYQTPYPSLGAAYDNVGVTADNATNAGDIDGFGSSFSASALAALGVSPGSQIHYDGLTFTWPDVQAGEPDNVLANGQIIDLSGSGSTLGLLLTSVYPTLSTGTVVYTDGSSQRFTVNLPNWDAPRSGDSVVLTTAYRNRPGNTQDTDKVSVFYVGVPLAAGKTVKQLILPAVGDTVSVPSLHVWSVAIG